MGSVLGNLGGEIFLRTVCWVGVSVSTRLAGHALGQPVGCTHEPGSHGMWGQEGCVARISSDVIETQRKGLDTVSKSLTLNQSRTWQILTCKASSYCCCCFFFWLLIYFFSNQLCLLVKRLFSKDVSLFEGKTEKTGKSPVTIISSYGENSAAVGWGEAWVISRVT